MALARMRREGSRRRGRRRGGVRSGRLGEGGRWSLHDDARWVKGRWRRGGGGGGNLLRGGQPQRLRLVEQLGRTPGITALLVEPWRVAAHAIAFEDAVRDDRRLVGHQHLRFAVGERRHEWGSTQLVGATW